MPHIWLVYKNTSRNELHERQRKKIDFFLPLSYLISKNYDIAVAHKMTSSKCQVYRFSCKTALKTQSRWIVNEIRFSPFSFQWMPTIGVLSPLVTWKIWRTSPWNKLKTAKTLIHAHEHTHTHTSLTLTANPGKQLRVHARYTPCSFLYCGWSCG